MEIIVGKTAGFCSGVKRAVDGTKKELEMSTKKQIDCLGEIVHNRQVIKELQEKGLRLIDNIEDGRDEVIIRAHGIQKEVYEIAEQKNIKVRDYTCPNVLKIHKLVEKYIDKGYYILLCGSKNHPENIGTVSYCNNNYSIIENEDDALEIIDEIIESKVNKILLIAQTTYSLEKFYIIEEILKNELPKSIELVVNNTICKATELRQIETEKLSRNVDYMIIIGGKNSSNSKKLYEIAKKYCENGIFIETEKELDVDEINKYEKIGIMAGASTPKESIDYVVEKLESKFNKKSMINI